jgi:TolB-like protein
MTVRWSFRALAILLALGVEACASGPTSRPAGAKTATRPVRRTVFAAPFENATKREQYDPAAAGMGDLVAVLLARHPHITVVERQRLMVLTEEQARSLKGLTGSDYALKAGRLLKADTLITGRMFLIKDKLTVSVQALDIATARVVAADQLSCRPAYLLEASLQAARKIAENMAMPLPKIDLKKIDKSPIASLHFAKALSHYYAGNLDAAIMQFMRTMDLDPDFVEAHYFSGLCYQRLGEDAHAIIEWEKFLTRRPKSERAKKVSKLLAEAKEREKESPVERLGPKLPTTKPK